MKNKSKNNHKSRTYDNQKTNPNLDDGLYDESSYEDTLASDDNEDDLVMLDLEDFDNFESYNSDESQYDESVQDDLTDDEDDEHSPVSIMKIFNAILLTIIIMLLIVGGIKLYQWQKGKDLVITDADILADYNTESEDWYVYFDPKDDPNFVDDGQYNILILGDSLIYNYDDETSIQSIIAQNTGANVTALSLPYTTVSLHNETYNPDYPQDAYSLFYLASAMAAGDMGNFDLMMSSWGAMEDYGVYYDYWDVLHKIKFDDIDVLIICYNYDDFVDGIPFVGDEVWSEQPYGTMDSYNGALDASLKLLKDRFPHMQIIVSSPSFFMVDDKGQMIGGDLYNNGSGTLGEYVVNMKSVSQLKNVSFVDNYFGIDFSCDNYEMYLEDDMRHPNEAGRKLIADHITDFIYFMRKSNVVIDN